MKKILLLFFLIVFLFSCQQLRDKGYLKHKLGSSPSMKIYYAGFDYSFQLNHRIKMQYKLTIRFHNILNTKGKYIVAEYQDPKRRNDIFIKQVNLLNKKDDAFDLRSIPMYGFKQKGVYMVKIKLSEDQYGHNVIEEINQPIRVDCIPYGYINEI